MLSRILEVQKFFTLRDLIWQSVAAAKGCRWLPHHCYICGRQEDFIFGLTQLIPHLDMSLEDKLVYVCDDHGKVTDYNCVTGEVVVILLPRPYWYRCLRNFVQRLILQIAFIVRFVYFFSYSWFIWHVAIWLVFIYRFRKRNVQEIT